VETDVALVVPLNQKLLTFLRNFLRSLRPCGLSQFSRSLLASSVGGQGRLPLPVRGAQLCRLDPPCSVRCRAEEEFAVIPVHGRLVPEGGHGAARCTWCPRRAGDPRSQFSLDWLVPRVYIAFGSWARPAWSFSGARWRFPPKMNQV